MLSVFHSIAVGGVVGSPLMAVGDITGAAIVTGIFGLIQLSYNEYLRRSILRTTAAIQETQVVVDKTETKVKELDRRSDW